MTTDDDQLLSLGEVAQKMGISVEGVRRRIRNGQLGAVKLGDPGTPAPIRVRREDVRRYIDLHQINQRQKVA